MQREYELSFVIMEHGFMGSHMTFQHLEETLLAEFQEQLQRCRRRKREEEIRESTSIVSGQSSSSYGSSSALGSPRSRDIIVLNHKGNDGKRCYAGIEKCADRLVSFVLSEVVNAVKSHQSEVLEEEEAVLHAHRASISPGGNREGSGTNPLVERPLTSIEASLDGESSSSSFATAASVPSSQARSSWKLTFHVLGYSLGGLIVRAALPALSAGLTKRFLEGGQEHDYRIIWDMFFSLCSPHVGSSVGHPMIHSSYRLAGCLSSVCLLPRVVEDMMLKNDYVENVLLSPSYLEALRRFNRRIFIALTNDRMVWNYSSAFFLPPIERRLLDGWAPEDPVFNPSALQSRLANNPKGAGCPRPSASEEGTGSSLVEDIYWTTPVGSPGRGVMRPGSNCEEANNIDNSVELGGVSTRSSSAKVPWLLYGSEEKEIKRETMSLLSMLSLKPATSLREMLENGITIQQRRSDNSAGDGSGNTSELEFVYCASDLMQNDRARLNRSTFLRRRKKKTVVVDHWITEESWPSSYLPRERGMAVSFLHGVGPVELHLVDLEQMAVNYVDDVLRCSEPGSPHELDVIEGLFTATITRGHQLVLYPGSKKSSHHSRSPSRKGGSSNMEDGQSQSLTGQQNEAGDPCTAGLSHSDEREQEEEPVGNGEDEGDHVNPFGFVANFLVTKILSFPSSRTGSESKTMRRRKSSNPCETYSRRSARERRKTSYTSVDQSQSRTEKTRRSAKRQGYSPSIETGSPSVAITSAKHVSLTAGRHTPGSTPQHDKDRGRVWISDENKGKPLSKRSVLPNSRPRAAKLVQPTKKEVDMNEVPVISIPQFTPRKENRRAYHRKTNITIQKEEIESREDTQSDYVIPLC